MNNKLQPALIGGVALGLLSAIPFVNYVNFFCCLWAIVGGLAAAYLYIKNSATPVKTGDGALVGLLAGAIGAAVYLIVGIPLGILAFDLQAAPMMSLMERMGPEAAEAARQALEAQRGQPFFSQVIGALPGALFGAVLLAAFALVGGIIGVALFEKRKGDNAMPPPPPPGGYGGASPGAGTSDFGR